MEPKFNILESLLGNLNISPNINIAKDMVSSPGANAKLKNSTQINQLIIQMYADGKQINTVTNPSLLTKKHYGTFKSGYHATFLANGQVYFGKLELITNGKKFVKLKDIFYLKSDEAEITDGKAAINLFKLGQELHGPHDEMNINVDHISFWEKLRDDSPVVTAISDYYDHMQS